MVNDITDDTALLVRFIQVTFVNERRATPSVSYELWPLVSDGFRDWLVSHN